MVKRSDRSFAMIDVNARQALVEDGVPADSASFFLASLTNASYMNQVGLDPSPLACADWLGTSDTREIIEGHLRVLEAHSKLLYEPGRGVLVRSAIARQLRSQSGSTALAAVKALVSCRLTPAMLVLMFSEIIRIDFSGAPPYVHPSDQARQNQPHIFNHLMWLTEFLVDSLDGAAHARPWPPAKPTTAEPTVFSVAIRDAFSGHPAGQDAAALWARLSRTTGFSQAVDAFASRDWAPLHESVREIVKLYASDQITTLTPRSKGK